MLQPRSHWMGWIFFFNDTATTEIYTLSLHDALPLSIYENDYDRLSLYYTELFNRIHKNKSVFYFIYQPNTNKSIKEYEKRKQGTSDLYRWYNWYGTEFKDRSFGTIRFQSFRRSYARIGIC